jgi:hypothetical protein
MQKWVIKQVNSIFKQVIIVAMVPFLIYIVLTFVVAVKKQKKLVMRKLAETKTFCDSAFLKSD